MNIRSLASRLEYRGEVRGKRQTYHVFESGRQYLVMSFSRTKPRAGNFNVVDVEAVEDVARRFGGRQGVTARAIFDAGRRPRGVSSSLAALNVLYVLVATGRAKVDRRFDTPELRFNLKKRADQQ